jgi:hypothetical protein
MLLSLAFNGYLWSDRYPKTRKSYASAKVVFSLFKIYATSVGIFQEFKQPRHFMTFDLKFQNVAVFQTLLHLLHLRNRYVFLPLYLFSSLSKPRNVSFLS